MNRGNCLALWCLPVILAGALGAGGSGLANPVAMDTYAQEFTISFVNEADAAKAAVEILPLYRGYEWAVSCRWDDNIETDFKMKETLVKYGYRANWYLYGLDSDWYGPDYGLFGPAGGPAGAARALAADGFAIAGHTLTHPWLEALNLNRIWWEIMGIRIAREAETDRPVISFGTPFGYSRDVTATPELFADIEESIRRAGYYHGDGPESFVGFNYLPGDGEEIDARVTELLGDRELRSRNPSMCLGYHVWYTTPEAWKRFEGQLGKYARNPKWWYCNWNEYAAYRWQAMNTRVETSRAGPGKVRVSLVRPELADLDDAVPLTFAVRGVNPGTVKAVEAGAVVEVLQPIVGAYSFNLGHDGPRALPAAIDQLPDGHGTPGEFRFINVSLTRKGNRLALELANKGSEPIAGLRVVYRLPPSCPAGVLSRKLGEVKAGESVRDELELTGLLQDWPHRVGDTRYVAQLDFVRGGSPGRLYVVATEPETGSDASYPRNGFLALGPLPEKASEARAFAAVMAAPASRPAKCRTESGRSFAWEAPATRKVSWVGPEIAATVADDKTPDDRPYHYLLLTSVVSDAARQAKLVSQVNAFVAVYLNGKEVSGDILDLGKGANDLLLLYSSGADKFSPRHYGAFVRLVDAKTGVRLGGIAYHRDRIKLASREATVTTGAAAIPKAARRILDDFEDGDMTDLAGANHISESNGTWALEFDGFSGSKATSEVARDSGNKSKAALHLSGFRGRNDPAANKWSYVTMAGSLSARSSAGVGSDLSGSRGVSFRARSAKSTKAELYAQEIWKGKDLSKNGSSHRVAFDTGPEWRDYFFSWDDFTQPPWICPGESCTGRVALGAITALTFSVPGDGADFDLWLDDVELVYE